MTCSRTQLRRLMACAGFILGMTLTAALFPARAIEEPDIRRDAVVAAVHKVMPSVVNIATETIVETRDPFDDAITDFFGYRRRPPQREKRYSLGSGVIIDEEGFVLTNEHVVRRADRIWVKLTEEAGGAEYEAIWIADTSRSDVALLKINATKGEKFVPVKFAQDDDLLLGETVIALGNPFGLGGSVSRGILSSKSRRPPMDDQPLDIRDWLQTDVPINHGNSGGPLVNLRGELIGLNNAVLNNAQGIGFAIPIKRVAEALSERLTPEVMKGMWFGARVKSSGVPLTVMQVQPESPADKAGLKEGDVILRINGKTARNFIEFTRELVRGDEKKDTVIQVRRAQETRDIAVRFVPEADVFNAELVKKKTGITLQEMPPESSIGGFAVTAVEPKTSASSVGLRPNYVIRAFDGQLPPNMVSLAKMISTKKPGEKLRLDVFIVMQSGRLQTAKSARTEIEIR